MDYYYDPRYITRNGVAYNLHYSPHELKMKYGECCLVYVFSSNYYKKLFEEKIEKHRSLVSEFISRKYKFTITNDILSDIKLYSVVEKRGFLIKIKGEGFDKWEKVEKLEHIILNGEIAMKKS